MSDVTREELKSLRQRVAELEAAIDSGSTSVESTSGLDHRDEKVLAHMRENGKRSGVALVKLYTSLTDIQNRNKAKRRAKTLDKTEVYRNL